MQTPFSILAWLPGPPEMIVIGVVALVIFGRRLPDVARSMGRSIVEFKKGLKDVHDDIDHAATPKELPPAGDSAETPSKSAD